MYVFYPAHENLVLIASARRVCAFACSHAQNVIKNIKVSNKI